MISNCTYISIFISLKVTHAIPENNSNVFSTAIYRYKCKMQLVMQTCLTFFKKELCAFPIFHLLLIDATTLCSL